MSNLLHMARYRGGLGVELPPVWGSINRPLLPPAWPNPPTVVTTQPTFPTGSSGSTQQTILTLGSAGLNLLATYLASKNPQMAYQLQQGQLSQAAINQFASDPGYQAYLRQNGYNDISARPGHLRIFGQEISYGTLVAVGGIILLIQMRPFSRK